MAPYWEKHIPISSSNKLGETIVQLVCDTWEWIRSYRMALNNCMKGVGGEVCLTVYVCASLHNDITEHMQSIALLVQWWKLYHNVDEDQGQTRYW